MLREETSGQNTVYLFDPGSYASSERIDQVEGEGDLLPPYGPYWNTAGAHG
jgi:hypothetical protein